MVDNNRLFGSRITGIKKLISKGVYRVRRAYEYIDAQERCENYYVTDDEDGDGRGDR